MYLIMKDCFVVQKTVSPTSCASGCEVVPVSNAVFNSVPIPSKIVDGEYVKCQAEEIGEVAWIECEPEPMPEPEPTTEDILNAMLGVN